MAVLIASSTSVFLALDQAGDNNADKNIALQNQVGHVETWVQSEGEILETRLGDEINTVDVGINMIQAQTFGNNNITVPSGPFEKSMTGLTVTIVGYGTRVITSVSSVTTIVFSGTAIPAGVVTISLPVGISIFENGVTYGDQRLSSVTGPFNATHIGTKVSIEGLGTRTVTAYNTDFEIEVDGAALEVGTGRSFSLSTDIEQSEQDLESASGQVIDSHRVGKMATPTIMRWAIGSKPNRGLPRTLHS